MAEGDVTKSWRISHSRRKRIRWDMPLAAWAAPTAES
jgi:hypothetical protein